LRFVISGALQAKVIKSTVELLASWIALRRLVLRVFRLATQGTN
jgi:hypothetical protein